MDVRLLFPSKYLAAVDLRGKDVVLTIRRVAVEELKTERGTEKKPLVYFKETAAKAEKTGDDEKRLVLNKTNAMTIGGIYGMEVDDWKDKPITLYPTKVQAFGEMKDCIRVRPEAPKKPENAPAG